MIRDTLSAFNWYAGRNEYLLPIVCVDFVIGFHAAKVLVVNMFKGKILKWNQVNIYPRDDHGLGVLGDLNDDLKSQITINEN